MSACGGSSLVGAGGDGSDESGESEVTSIEGDKWRVEDVGVLGVGESSGTGGGGGGTN